MKQKTGASRLTKDPPKGGFFVGVGCGTLEHWWRLSIHLLLSRAVERSPLTEGRRIRDEQNTAGSIGTSVGHGH